VSTLVLLAGASAVQEHVARARSRAGESPANAGVLTPGEFAGTVLLGGFRGLAVDVLWLRTCDLARSGRHHEALALCRLISKLQPHFAEAWLFGAWTLCGPLAREETSDEARWDWTHAAIVLLEEGRNRNPGAWDLVFFHGWVLENVVARAPYLRQQAERMYGRNVHDLAARSFRKHVDFDDACVLPPYRRAAGHAYRAWAEDLVDEARRVREKRTSAPGVDARGALVRERALLRRAVARLQDAQREWQRLLLGEAPVGGERFVADTESLIKEAAEQEKAVLEQIQQVEGELTGR
jgi:hypothetical protein